MGWGIWLLGGRICRSRLGLGFVGMGRVGWGMGARCRRVGVQVEEKGKPHLRHDSLPCVLGREKEGVVGGKGGVFLLSSQGPRRGRERQEVEACVRAAGAAMGWRAGVGAVTALGRLPNILYSLSLLYSLYMVPNRRK